MHKLVLSVIGSRVIACLLAFYYIIILLFQLSTLDKEVYDMIVGHSYTQLHVYKLVLLLLGTRVYSVCMFKLGETKYSGNNVPILYLCTDVWLMAEKLIQIHSSMWKDYYHQFGVL